MKVVLFRASILFFGMAALGTSASFALERHVHRERRRGVEQSGWFWQNPLPQGNILRATAAVDANTVIAVGDLGTILRTTDGGATWTLQSSGTTKRFFGLSFVDANNGTVVGEGGAILR